MSTRVDLFPALKTAASDGVSQGPNVASCGTAFDGVQSFGANCYTLPLPMKDVDRVCLQVSLPANSTGQGSVSIQGTNYPYEVKNPSINTSIGFNGTLATWSTLTFLDEATATSTNTKSIANNGTTSVCLTVQACGVSALRALWTNTAGTAPVRMDMMCKSDGGR